MEHNARVLVCSAQKGGVGKTASAINLGVALAKHGKKVLLIDNDIHASMTIRLGYPQPDTLSASLATIMVKSMKDVPFEEGEAILSHPEGIDFIPSNRQLAEIDISLAGMCGRESVLRSYVDTMRSQYDFIFIDCLPSLGLLAINALTAAGEVMIITKADFDSGKGVEDLLISIANIRKRIHPTLKIAGVLFTMVDMRTKDAKETIEALETAYGSQIPFYQTKIPASVRAREAGKYGISIFSHDPRGRVAAAYHELAKEVLQNE
jgi:ATPases involved in chromosome partitioning